jgi:hypothetical protein
MTPRTKEQLDEHGVYPIELWQSCPQPAVQRSPYVPSHDHPLHASVVERCTDSRSVCSTPQPTPPPKDGKTWCSARCTSVGNSSADSRSRAFQPPTLIALKTHAATTDHTGSAGAAANPSAATQAPARQMHAVRRRPSLSTMKMLAMLPAAHAQLDQRIYRILR